MARGRRPGDARLLEPTAGGTAQNVAAQMRDSLTARRPPLWLAAAGLSAGYTVAFGVVRWVDHFLTQPDVQDLRLHLIAARVGLKYGWSHIYEVDLQKEAARGLSPPASVIDSMHLFISPPPTAWMLAPLAGQSPAVSYLVWTVISLVAFVAAGWLLLPGGRLTRVTVLLVSLGLWPVHYGFWDGQTVAGTIALLAVSYWLLERDRWALSGVAMALAFCLKPQDALLLPLALLLSGRWRPVAAFAVTGAVIVATWAASLGPAGIASWLNDISIIRSNPYNSPLTYSFIVGHNAAATGLELALAFIALGLVWYRRDRLDLVFSLGLVATTMSASYLHEFDVAILVVAAWIVMRTRLSLPMRIWLVAGIPAAQFIAIGLPIPMLLWQPIWMALLGLEPWMRRREGTIAVPRESERPLALDSSRS
ncbi:MAG: DUF2029 domain-containing protein [Chloroflexi bacterium]|nr:MAG: DUF2029 domain-containing protein [Chloroflexota bacterium]